MSFSFSVRWLIDTPQVTGSLRALAARTTARLSAHESVAAW